MVKVGNTKKAVIGDINRFLFLLLHLIYWYAEDFILERIENTSPNDNT